MAATRWNMMYTLVMEYVAANGGLPAAPTVWHGQRIGEWLMMQQRALARGELPSDQVALLHKVPNLYPSSRSMLPRLGTPYPQVTGRHVAAVRSHSEMSDRRPGLVRLAQLVPSQRVTDLLADVTEPSLAELNALESEERELLGGDVTDDLPESDTVDTDPKPVEEDTVPDHTPSEPEVAAPLRPTAKRRTSAKAAKAHAGGDTDHLQAIADKLAELDREGAELRVPMVHAEVLVHAEDWPSAAALLERPGTELVGFPEGSLGASIGGQVIILKFEVDLTVAQFVGLTEVLGPRDRVRRVESSHGIGWN